MDVRQLRYFSEIVEAKSFTRAANRVRIAQPALGLQIRKLEDELADFLYRFSIQGKSFIIELEAGNDKTTGVSLGHIEEASQPRLIDVPYFNLGDNSPQILCTSGVFVSSLLDWYHSRASTLYAPLADDGQNKIALNGGCTYIANSDGKRNPLQER